jgi:peptide deformylase
MRIPGYRRIDRAVWLVAAACILFLASCAGPGKKGAFDSRRLTAAEIERIRSGDADGPMRVVLNESREGDALLRTPCRPVAPGDEDATRLIARMLATVREQEGVGIAAPQVGINRRVILVQRLDRKPEQPFVAYLNPEITEMSKAWVLDWEGCLSIPAGCGKVKRARAIVIAYVTPAGEPRTEKVEGFTARIFQHEIDHLDGVLFIDRMEAGTLISREALREIRRKEKEER